MDGSAPSIRRLTLASLILACVLATPAAGQNPPAAPAAGSQPGLLLLVNGGVIAGQVVQAGDTWQVSVPGGEIRVRAAEVEGFCRNFDEGYRLKQAKLDPQSLPGHLRLADWCIRFELPGHASRELAEAMRIDPNDPQVLSAQRKLETLLARQREPAKPAAPVATGPSVEELDTMVRQLPANAVESFTVSVQTVLANRCLTSGCHGAQHQGLSLTRAPSGRRPSRRATQRNLFAVLQQVDRVDPESSPLIVTPRQPHGGGKAAVFAAEDDPHYVQLRAWVLSLGAPDKTPTHVATGAKPASLANPRHNTNTPASIKLTSDPGPGAASVPDNAAAPGESTSAVKSEKPSQDAAAEQDPFDPAIFNQKYRKPAAKKP